MQDHELTAWLGDGADEVTSEQRAALQRAHTSIAARYPHEDLDEQRERAFTGAAMVILGGDSTLEEIAAEWQEAWRIQVERHAALTGALIASEGTEVALAERAGVTRMTVRKALGK